MPIHFEWTPDMSVAESTIDAQHKRLLAQVNNLIDAMVYGSASAEVATALRFLDQYINEHFAYEEAYMRDRGFSDFDAHVARHEEFRNKYAAFREKLSAGETPEGVLLDIEGFLGNWWIEHIGHEDHRYFLELGAAQDAG